VELRGLEPLDSVSVGISTSAFDLLRSISAQFVSCDFRFGVLTASTRRTAPLGRHVSAHNPKSVVPDLIVPQHLHCDYDRFCLASFT
jgi:hypothetical protein